MLFKWDPSDSETVVKLENVVEKFVEAFNRKHGDGHANSLKEVDLFDHGKHPVSLDSRIDSVVQDKMDLFVVFKRSGRENHIVNECHARVLEKFAKFQENGSTSAALGNITCKAATKTESSVAKSLETAEQLRQSGKIRRAVEVYRTILKEEDKTNQTALLALVDIFQKARRPQVALVHAASLVDFYPNDKKMRAKMAECMVPIGNHTEAQKHYYSYIKQLEEIDGPVEELYYAFIGLGRAFMAEGRKQAALGLFSDVLKRNPEHKEGLKNYAIMKGELSKGPLDLREAIRVLLTLMVNDQRNKEIQDYLARVMQLPGAMAALKIEMKAAWEAAAAIVYVATCLRDNGAIKEALKLSDRALTLDGNNPSVFLFVVHLFEIVDEHNEAFLATRNFLDCSKLLLQRFRVSSLVPPLRGVKDIYLYQKPPKKSFPEVALILKTSYTVDEGQLLAILFTMVRILFFKGAVNLVKPLLPLLQKFHEGRDLHVTVIRNEAAYFSTINHVMRVPIEPLPASPKFVYFVSDSHCIPPAWRTLQYHGETRIIHPAVSVGMKIWHLNSKCKFYPKTAFYHAIGTIPDGVGSPVIFNFGELDCREGLLVAVEKCKYDTLEDAALETVEIYVEVLRQLVEKHKFTVFVHPVLPVLDETRSVVQLFNKILKSKVKHAQGLHWLRFLDHLLTDNGQKLKSEYTLDGTHAHPKYVSLLERAVNDVKL